MHIYIHQSVLRKKLHDTNFEKEAWYQMVKQLEHEIQLLNIAAKTISGAPASNATAMASASHV